MLDYLVTYTEGRWRVQPPNGASVTHPTQQAAVEAAKSAAVREQVDVTWTDRDGKPQGRARFRPAQPPSKSIIRRKKGWRYPLFEQTDDPIRPALADEELAEMEERSNWQHPNSRELRRVIAALRASRKEVERLRALTEGGGMSE